MATQIIMPTVSRCASSLPGQRGLALAGTLVLLGLLAVSAAIAQRAAAWQWRAAQLQAERLQLREDAMTAQAAALQWLRAGGWRAPAQDCASLREPARRPTLCADPVVEPRHPPWSQTWSRDIDGCVHACGFRVQRLPASPDGAPTLRILSYASGGSVRVLQHDVSVAPRRDAAASQPEDEPADTPCWHPGDWRVWR